MQYSASSKLMFRRLVISLFCVPIFLSAWGCGNGMVPVSGTVMVDGKPAEGVSLMFRPIKGGKDVFPSTGTSQKDGAFSLTTNLEKGIPKGEYTIMATWPDPNYKGKAAGYIEAEPAPDLFNGKYLGASGVKAKEIDGPIHDFVIELTTAAPH